MASPFNAGALVVLIQLVLSSPARAGGYSYPGLGTAAMARGGAFVARADDPTAIWYNPAGAARHAPGTHLLLDVNIFSETFSFQRRILPVSGAEPGAVVPPDRYPHDPGARIPAVTSTDGPMIIPFLSVVSDLGGLLAPLNLRLMAGLYGPNAHPDRTYPRYCLPDAGPRCSPSALPTGLPGPTRYDTLATSILVLNPSVGLAWQPAPGLSVGAVFQAAYASFSLRKVVLGFVDYARGQPLEDPGQDIDIHIDAEDLFTPSGAFGVHWQAASFLELGLSVQLPLTHDAEGTVSVDLPRNLSKLGVSSSPSPAAVKVQIPFPWIVRAGARYVNRDGGGRERFDLEVDVVWESTSHLDQLNVETDATLKLSQAPGVKPIPLQTLSQEYRWKDTWGVRAGGSYRLHDLLAPIVLILRAGFFYESSAATDEYLRLDFMPLERMGVTAGVGVRRGRLRVDLGYAHLFHTSRDVGGECGAGGCGSEAVAVIPIAPYAGYPVGNGTYDLDVDLFSLGATVSF